MSAVTFETPSSSRRAASGAILKFLNRASDAVYAMARFADVSDPELFAGRDAGEDG